MCFGPSTLGAGAKTRLESRTKKFTPHCVCRLGIFLDHGCAHNIYLTDEIGLTDSIVTVPPYAKNAPSTVETRSNLVFPSLSAAVKTWELDPFGLEEYQTPFGDEMTAPLIDAAKYTGTASFFPAIRPFNHMYHYYAFLWGSFRSQVCSSSQIS